MEGGKTEEETDNKNTTNHTMISIYVTQYCLKREIIGDVSSFSNKISKSC